METHSSLALLDNHPLQIGLRIAAGPTGHVGIRQRQQSLLQRLALKGGALGSVRRLALSGATVFFLAALATAAGTAFPSGTSDDAPPIYTNAQVVAVDVVGRTLVIKNARGLEEKVQLDDTLGGFGDIRAGDQVILTLRTGPGWTPAKSPRPRNWRT